MSSPITSIPLGGSAQLVAQLLENGVLYAVPVNVFSLSLALYPAPAVAAAAAAAAAEKAAASKAKPRVAGS